jgi:hypothetical protein
MKFLIVLFALVVATIAKPADQAGASGAQTFK